MLCKDQSSLCFLCVQGESAARLHRFYVQHSLQTESPAAGSLALEQDEARHAIKALRLTEGSQVQGTGIIQH